jgi:hypothetical protein
MGKHRLRAFKNLSFNVKFLNRTADIYMGQDIRVPEYKSIRRENNWA